MVTLVELTTEKIFDNLDTFIEKNPMLFKMLPFTDSL